MNEYNERTLKNVLDDYMEEQDKDFLKEIEEAANNPLYQNKEGEAEAFVNKHFSQKKKNIKKILLRVASILIILAIGLSIIPISVEGRKSTIAELIVNYVNSEFLAFDNNENDNLLLSFEGNYVPTWIPDGYEVESVNNKKDKKEIIFVNADEKMIRYKEQSSELKTKVDSENNDNVTHLEVNGFKAIYIEEDDIKQIVITTDDTIIYISSDDVKMDLIGFADLLEKR